MSIYIYIFFYLCASQHIYIYRLRKKASALVLMQSGVGLLWFVGWLLQQVGLVDWSVGRLVGRLAGWLVCCFAGRFVGGFGWWLVS